MQAYKRQPSTPNSGNRRGFATAIWYSYFLGMWEKRAEAFWVLPSPTLSTWLPLTVLAKVACSSASEWTRHSSQIPQCPLPSHYSGTVPSTILLITCSTASLISTWYCLVCFFLGFLVYNSSHERFHQQCYAFSSSPWSLLLLVVRSHVVWRGVFRPLPPIALLKGKHRSPLGFFKLRVHMGGLRDRRPVTPPLRQFKWRVQSFQPLVHTGGEAIDFEG